ncbi:thiamine phosphate synthase [Pedobacter psychroterrae]|uniref:Thiamine phosphate synthase n=1 Tax=Pedobacter psychroterrae TaxID=2530453 RepID=A0A4R0NE28_9SPHI|nr:thiamine phosphate synthase [Pedobacter psychroterrae]TCC97372.1 thiamine phosphate synthase [Pedobacter psychroterrae]
MKELIVISSAEYIAGEIALVNGLFDAGMGLFHLRKPGTLLVSYRTLLNGINPDFRDKVVLHQFHESGALEGIHRFHFSEAERQRLWTKDQRFGSEIKGSSASTILSTSIHSLEQADELMDFDYVFFGPVFDSISKPGRKGIDLHHFILPVHLKAKLVALGGITQDNIAEVFDLGFDKAAVLGALWNNPSEAPSTFKQISKNANG